MENNIDNIASSVLDMQVNIKTMMELNLEMREDNMEIKISINDIVEQIENIKNIMERDKEIDNNKYLATHLYSMGKQRGNVL